VTRADRHRLLDMREAVDDLTAIEDRGRAAWDDDKSARLAAQKLLDLMWEQLATQLPSLRQALGQIDPDELEEA
jgi:hypothetical protein